MILTDQSVQILLPDLPTSGVSCLKKIEYAARNCYASQDKITEDSCYRMVKSLIARGHDAPLEFADMTVDITTSRAVLAEITRHRMSSFCVESQRYIQEAKTGDITFIKPDWYNENEEDDMSAVWHSSMRMAEIAYKNLINEGAKPEQAREVLPNSTACRIIMKANLREWRHVFSLRCADAAYPPMRFLMRDLLKKAHDIIPVVFDDIYDQYFKPQEDTSNGLLSLET